MTTDALFCSLSPVRGADLVRRAQYAVCYAAPGIQLDLAQAMVETASRLGKEMLTVSLDFDDRVMRMGYRDIGAVKLLLEAGIAVQSSPGGSIRIFVCEALSSYPCSCSLVGNVRPSRPWARYPQ